ncbi:MAG: hypothetical protein KKG99_07365 [Bacteroidetes bacterium]|nr:hypothetical protein [Bacteroidota bacterium]
MRFIKHYTILMIISFCISMAANAQNVDDIIAKHIQAHGGAEKWDAIKSMEINARFTAFSEENEWYAIKTNTGAYYSDLQIGQHKVKEAFNGKSGWTIDPWHDFTFPRLLNKVEDNVFQQKAEFFSPFYKYKEKGRKVEYAGEAKIDGVDTYVLKLTRSNGLVETWYLNKATYLEVKSISDWVDFGSRVSAESFFDDFREVNGLVIPFFVERMFGQRDRILVIENIKLNASVDESIFEMPKSNEMQKLAFLAGDWNVKVEAPGRNNTWRTADQTSSNAQFIATNNLQQNISVSEYYVQSMIINYSFYQERNKYRLTIYNGFSSSSDLYEGNFVDGVFTADNTSVKYNDAESNAALLQLSIYNITPDAFMMEIKNSADKGATWRPAYKLSYSRK